MSASNPFNFNHHAVHFHVDNQVKNISSSVDNPQKRRRVIYLTDSYQVK